VSHDIGAPASPVPGWYPDPADAQALRWWDGSQWVDRTQPVSAGQPVNVGQPVNAGQPASVGQPVSAGQPMGAGMPMGPGPMSAGPMGAGMPTGPGMPMGGGPMGAGPMGPGPMGAAMPAGAGIPMAGPVAVKGAPVPWAWAVAATPLILLAVAALFAALGGENGSTSGYIFIGVVAAAVIAVFMSYRDARMLVTSGDLRGAGIAWWSLLSPWAYLWARAAKRSNRTNMDWILLAASVAGWVLIVAIATPVINNVAVANTSFNRVKVQTDIARGIRNQLGVRATVDCPQDPPIHPGSTFQCIARAADGSRAMVTVTIQDRSGDYTWRTSQ
jgi:hypothetical protein